MICHWQEQVGMSRHIRRFGPLLTEGLAFSVGENLICPKYGVILSKRRILSIGQSECENYPFLCQPESNGVNFKDKDLLTSI
jgi:hypothetical protein